MSSVVNAAKKLIPSRCQVSTCRKGGCSLSMKGAPAPRLVVDIDCNALLIPAHTKRCDYVFIGQTKRTTVVAPVELKAVAFRGGDVVNQLQAGADLAGHWIQRQAKFHLVPILAYGKVAAKARLKALRKTKIKLHGQERQAVLIRCGQPIVTALASLTTT